MRLTAIKLAGFKSFVDPTHLRLTSNLTGVVGPNGCGKSNVIDAVRWVTGESSAKQLRGEALEDVIFNGSRARKPVGRASVELLFDNSSGRLGGQYASFSEISIRRELSRDGGSRYAINGARCRRRDVIDLFLGTGLGGRNNYAVIEQGSVNRLIEARPEDMRHVLEEAAGISKYKERRRETENRIGHTRENLDRLNDLIGEVSQRLAQLKRQASNAEKYKQYKAEERQLKAQLLALRWRGLQQQAERHEATLEQCRKALETARAKTQEVTRRRDQQRSEQQQAAHECQRLQADFYAAEAEVARVDQALAHARELRQMRAAEIEDLARQLTEWDERIDAQTHATGSAGKQVEESNRALDQAGREQAAAEEQLETAERAARDGEQQWDALNADEHNPVQRAQAERSQVEYLEQGIAALGTRLDRLLGEHQRLDDDAYRHALAEAEDKLAACSSEMDALRADAQAREAQLAQLRSQRGDNDANLHETRQKLASARGRLTSLESLQQAALREDDAELQQWLGEQDWQDARGVAHAVRVADGWEQAAEAALGGFLRALALPGLEARIASVAQWPQQAVILLDEDSDGATGPGEAGPPAARSLASVLQGPLALRRLAQRIFLVEDDAAARAALPALREGQMLATRAGVCFGPGWVRSPRQVDPEEGLLRREQAITELRNEVEQLAAAEADRQRTQDDLRERLRGTEEQRSEQSTRLDGLRKRHGEHLAERQGLQVRLEQSQRRRRELDTEIADLRKQQGEHESELQQARARLESVAGAAREHVQLRQTAQQRLQDLRAQLDQARQARDAARSRGQQLQVALAGHRSDLQGAEQRLAESRERREQLQARHQQLQTEAQQPDSAGQHDEQTRNAAAARCESARLALSQARDRLAEVEQRAVGLGEQAHAAEQAQEAASEAVQSARVDSETSAVRSQGVAEQLAESGHSPQALCEELPDDADAQAWEQRIETLERRIQRLGAINLAAIEEFEEEQQRETYLQEQHTDLREALATLETAIAKIDRETRSRFRSTFDAVNERFGALFPTLFGGGEARLELTEDDLLATGVRVMARPPGKRNASIQMLSGGEKALAAVALLFALFELNPAPFCMLDEIDAPLDDSNVARFCDLVRKMSDHVQFIVITHNKVTMELVHQLHGVTMAEPGVSRLVSVDVDKALELAS